MAAAAKTKKRPPKKKKKKRAQRTSKIHFPVTVKGDEGNEVLLPSIFEAVEEMFLESTRGRMVEVLTQRYQVTAVTIDRAIAEVKDAYAAESALVRQERMEKNYSRLVRVHRLATKQGALGPAVSAVREASKLMGDMKPDVVLQSTADMESDQLQAQAEELARIATKRSGTP